MESKNVLTLASGKQFQCKYFNIYQNSTLFINIDSNNLQEIVKFFSDVNETSVITFGGKEYRGFTVVLAVTRTTNGFYRVTLDKQG